ncbi:MAG: cytochrome c oxidase subunit 3 family protein [Bacteroidales bacterium]|nr:cytochrome c oxidase subunit 3 family protein [Bacteroidales bacterium]MCB8999693.1 cytochrome c oxidase subunit 3 family protein [Bacteroidales bacterium]
MEIHRDDEASKIGMWLFLFTEMLLFGGLFVVYSVYRFRNPEAFHLAAHELNVAIGTINTMILLVSSATIAMSITAIQLKNKKLALLLLGITIALGLAFLVNKYFEWGAKISHHIYPGSEIMAQRGQGDILFFGLYYFMTGLHALHIIIGLTFIAVVFMRIKNDKITHDNFSLLENSGLYWHLVDLIWIFLFPLFYLIT